MKKPTLLEAPKEPVKIRDPLVLQQRRKETLARIASNNSKTRFGTISQNELNGKITLSTKTVDRDKFRPLHLHECRFGEVNKSRYKLDMNGYNSMVDIEIDEDKMFTRMELFLLNNPSGCLSLLEKQKPVVSASRQIRHIKR